MGVVRGEKRDDVEREWTRTGESSNGAAIAPEGVKLARRARGDGRNGFARRAPTRALASRGARGVECDSGNGEAGDDARASAAADSCLVVRSREGALPPGRLVVEDESDVLSTHTRPRVTTV